ncbi:MAG TPA: DUF6544 family protein [Actinomycetota bacterium]|nr:DUF6544 family protein [Actinomycetota bacterium]
MSSTALDAAWPELEGRLTDPPIAGSFDEGELQGLPDPVCRYFRTSIAAGAPLARSARFGMRGAVKLERWWIPFRARQVYAPQHGLVWTARAGGVIAGYDRYADGQGAMQWKLLGLLRLLHAQGPDLSRSAAGRVAAEAVWVPTAMLPRFGVTWAAADAHHLTASWPLDNFDLQVHYTLDDDARVRSVALDRWGDPDSTGTFGLHGFGHELTRYSTFDGVTIPSAGRGGWFYGTDRWSEGEFFRYKFTDFHLITPASSAGS